MTNLITTVPFPVHIAILMDECMWIELEALTLRLLRLWCWCFWMKNSMDL